MSLSFGILRRVLWEIFAKLRAIALKIVLVFKVFDYFRREMCMMPDLFTVFLRR